MTLAVLNWAELVRLGVELVCVSGAATRPRDWFPWTGWQRGAEGRASTSWVWPPRPRGHRWARIPGHRLGEDCSGVLSSMNGATGQAPWKLCRDRRGPDRPGWSGEGGHTPLLPKNPTSLPLRAEGRESWPRLRAATASDGHSGSSEGASSRIRG